MASFNKVILMGNLTRDPELRVTPGGTSICKMGIATSRRFKTQSGEQREETTFVDVDAFGKQAEVISKYMTKGRPIMLEGRLRYDQWESNTGDKRSKLSVVLENFQFLGRGTGSDGGGDRQGPRRDIEENSPPPRAVQPAAADSVEAADGVEDVEDDVPF